MSRHRMGARGNATSFPLPWQDFLLQLKATDSTMQEGAQVEEPRAEQATQEGAEVKKEEAEQFTPEPHDFDEAAQEGKGAEASREE